MTSWGADSRARRIAAAPNRLSIKQGRPKVCHCEGALRPWQSREGSYDSADGFPTIRSSTARLHPKGTSSRFALRAPRRFAPRNDKLGGHCLFNIGPHFPPVRRREGTARPLQRAVVGPSKCKKPGMPDFPAAPIGSLTYRTVPWRGRGGRPRSGSSAAPRGPRCRWSHRQSCR